MEAAALNRRAGLAACTTGSDTGRDARVMVSVIVPVAAVRPRVTVAATPPGA